MRFEIVALAVVAAVTWCAGLARGDGLLHRYEGDVHLLEPQTGWISANRCEKGCTDFAQDGRFLVQWDHSADHAGYHFWIAQPPVVAPPSLWVEWRFRSSEPISGLCFGFDAAFVVDFRLVSGVVYLHANGAGSASGDDIIVGLDAAEFHTYRFESQDGTRYAFSVDGVVFTSGVGRQNDNGFHYLQIFGFGGCSARTTNEWDYIRHGTLSLGETIITANPPSGVLDARVDAARDRFTVTFDSPNYVYIRDIEIQVSDGSEAPVVAQTRRRETNNDSVLVDIDPRVVEIVLDRPIPMSATTRFTISDGEAVNVIEYTFARGDTDGTGAVDLADAAYLQNCFGASQPTGACLAIDLDRNASVDQLDTGLFNEELVGPRP